jgi:hypothetical protein
MSAAEGARGRETDLAESHMHSQDATPHPTVRVPPPHIK